MIKNKINFQIKFLTLILAILCLFTFVFNINTATAFAISEIATNVLEDLQNDENFNVDDYPLVENNYSLQVMQIAECQEGLLVYVYQPSGSTKDFRATTINISTENLSYLNYKLDFLNSSGVFYKYIIKGFRIEEKEERHYNISSIFRKFNSDIDQSAEGGNTITEVAYSVSKEWTAKDVDGKTIYNACDIETIEITDKFVGFVRYKNGPVWLGHPKPSFDSHFVAFSTDRRIDKLKEADVYYTTQSYNFNTNNNPKETFGDVKENYAYLSSENHIIHETNNIWTTTYEWDRIQTVNQFIESVELNDVYECGLFNIATETKLTDQGKSNLEGKKWVLRFAETDWNVEYKTGFNTTISESKTKVGNVTILRLKFITDGKLYNLGVIDNKQTGSDKPINTNKTGIQAPDWLKDVFKWLKWIFVGIIAILLISLIIAFWTPISKFLMIIWKCISAIFKGIWWFITLPFRIFKKRKK